MPKTKISEFDTNPDNNTDINSINIAEGCAPSGINNAIRQLMADLKEFQTGAASDPLTVGGVATFTAGSASAPAITTAGDTNTGIFFPAADTIAFAEGGAEAMRIDSSGNLGLGVTPSAWQSNRKAIQVSGSAANYFAGAGGSTIFGSNYFVDSAGNEKFVAASGYAQLYYQDTAGSHKWFTSTAASVSAGSAVTLTQAMTLDASGNLGIRATSPNAQLTLKSPSAAGTNSMFSIQAAGSTDKLLKMTVNQDLDVYSFGTDISVGKLAFETGGTERMRIDSSGRLLVGVTSGSYTLVVADGMAASGASGAAFPTANSSCQYVGKQSNNRSISAAGTINASGADYAEYMTKAGDFVIAKGDVCGIDANGKLTNVFADSVSFVVKSTDPSYVGGDVWANGLGNRPSEDASQVEKDTYELALEAAKKTVDRIAFAGQVPVNVIGANAGQYIVPVNDNGAIKGEAVSSPTFEQYQISVGKVIAIETDGRAKIIVKVA